MTEDGKLIPNIYKVYELDLSDGDYVFVSRWSDCDPNDPWAVGFVSYIDKTHVRVANKDGSDIEGVGKRLWPNAIKISKEDGERIIKSMNYIAIG